MTEWRDALADTRDWLCDHLSDGDAGKACGLLSDVSRHIARLEAENVRLREMLAEDNEELTKMRRVIDYLYFFVKACGVDAEDMRELGVEVDG